jgi:hypothetical protein
MVFNLFLLCLWFCATRHLLYSVSELINLCSETVNCIDSVKNRRQRISLTDMTKNLLIQTGRMSAFMIWLMIFIEH